MADENGTQTTVTEPQNNSTQQQVATPPPAQQAASQAANTAEAQTVVVDGKTITVADLIAENARHQREAESARVSAKAQVAKEAQKRQLLSVAELAGIKIDKPEDETVETLTQKLAGQAAQGGQNDAAQVAAKRDAAVVSAAWTAGAPADKATYLKFLASQDSALQALDPNANDYQTNVDARIKAIVDADPIFKATPGGAGRSGSEAHSGAGATGTVTQEVFDKMTIQEQTKLYQENPDLFRRLAGA